MVANRARQARPGNRHRCTPRSALSAVRSSGENMTASTMTLQPPLQTKGGMCSHQPPCPDALAPDRLAAWPVARRTEQGWSLLCNGVVLFDDGGQLLPDGRAISPAP